MVRTLQEPAEVDNAQSGHDVMTTDAVDTQVFRLMCEQLAGRAPRQLRNGGIVEFSIKGERFWLKAIRSYADIHTVSGVPGYPLPEVIRGLFEGSSTIDIQSDWATRTFRFQKPVLSYGIQVAGGVDRSKKAPVKES